MQIGLNYALEMKSEEMTHFSEFWEDIRGFVCMKFLLKYSKQYENRTGMNADWIK